VVICFSVVDVTILQNTELPVRKYQINWNHTITQIPWHRNAGAGAFGPICRTLGTVLAVSYFRCRGQQIDNPGVEGKYISSKSILHFWRWNMGAKKRIPHPHNVREREIMCSTKQHGWIYPYKACVCDGLDM